MKIYGSVLGYAAGRLPSGVALSAAGRDENLCMIANAGERQMKLAGKVAGIAGVGGEVASAIATQFANEGVSPRY